MDVSTIALSGLNAAERRLANSASNIANAETPGFKPTDVVQTAEKNGGVRADVIERSPAAETVAGRDGLEERPNVSIDEELINAQSATYDFQANIQVLKRAKEMDKALLDIQA